jgi:hypothetical protein
VIQPKKRHKITQPRIIQAQPQNIIIQSYIIKRYKPTLNKFLSITHEEKKEKTEDNYIFSPFGVKTPKREKTEKG